MAGIHYVPIDEVWHFSFNTRDPVGGGLTDADSTPTCSVFEEDTDTAIRTPAVVGRSALTGCYRVADTGSIANGYEEGKWYTVEVAATVNSVLQKKAIGMFQVVSANGPDVNIAAINDNTASAIRLALSTGQIIPFTVNTATTAATTTVFAASDITEATADHYNNRVVLWTTGALVGQAVQITDYSLVSGEGKFTVSTMTDIPSSGDTGIII